VVLLEAVEIGWGSSGRNGGQALTGLACDMRVIERQLGHADARRIFDLSVAGIALIHARCARFGIDCDWQPGALYAAVTAAKARALAGWRDELARGYGYERLQLVEAGAVRDWIDSPRYAGAALDQGSGQLDPMKYTRGLARAAAALGVAIHERSRVIALARGRRPALRTATGTVHCEQVLLAGNVHLGALVPQLAARIVPVGTYIAATVPLEPARARRLIPSGAAASDTQFILDYYRVTADHRLLFGGRVSYSGVTPPRLAASLRRRMLGVFPQLADVAIESTWGGEIDITLNRAPDFGRLDANVYYLQGFSGQGLALSGIAGQVAAEAIAGDAGRFDLFARLRHRAFPGGTLLRRPLLVLAMLWYRLRDLIG